MLNILFYRCKNNFTKKREKFSFSDLATSFLNKHKKRSVTATFIPLLHHTYKTVSQWIMLNILIHLFGIRKNRMFAFKKCVLYRNKERQTDIKL